MLTLCAAGFCRGDKNSAIGVEHLGKLDDEALRSLSTSVYGVSPRLSMVAVLLILRCWSSIRHRSGVALECSFLWSKPSPFGGDSIANPVVLIACTTQRC